MLDESASTSASTRLCPPRPLPQPDHFYSPDGERGGVASSSYSRNNTLLNPDEDPLATRGIPVFKPTMEEFLNFEDYMNRIECWGMRSGIVKVVPPKEWTDALPSIKEQLSKVRIKSPIEQHMLGNAGIFRQQNIERRKMISVREWAELCAKEDFRAPAVFEVGLKAPEGALSARRSRRRAASSVLEDVVLNGASSVKEELIDANISSPHPGSSSHNAINIEDDRVSISTPKVGGKASKPRDERKVKAERNAGLDTVFYECFDPHTSWLPTGTVAADYTPELCSTLERRYWRNCGLGRPAWYGADTAGSLFTDETTSWNVSCLPSALSRLLPETSAGLPGVNTPYLYFGMWRATFAWHVEDMDLFSINYIHFGAPKFWYAVPQGRASQLENTLRSYFPGDSNKCKQFLRHKSFFASPTLLAKGSCKPNTLVQHAGEFVITYPRGYHAGFNLGLNCAESVNFALDSWLDIGRKAKACGCVGDSVRIDVDALLQARREEACLSSADTENLEISLPNTKSTPMNSKSKTRKRKQNDNESSYSKKMRVSLDICGVPLDEHVAGPSTLSTPISPLKKIKLRIPAARNRRCFPCCLCVSQSTDGLLTVTGIPEKRSGCQNLVPRDAEGAEIWKAHEKCALIVPETWVDEIINDTGQKERVVFGVDSIVKDRWNLKCSACQKPQVKEHGAPIQCTKGKCPKAFHVSCACEGGPDARFTFKETSLVERQVVLAENAALSYPEFSTNQAQEEESTIFSNPLPLVAKATSLKTITKIEYEMLCSQHNPVTAALKKAGKISRVRTYLSELPQMSRIKVRVSTGVFEVSLISVDEDNGTVDVIWDGGIKRTFKWSSLVWGESQGEPIGHKPSVAAPPELQEKNEFEKKGIHREDFHNRSETLTCRVSIPYSNCFSVFPTNSAHEVGRFSYGSSLYEPGRDSFAVNSPLNTTSSSLSLNVGTSLNVVSASKPPFASSSTSCYKSGNHFSFPSQGYTSWKINTLPNVLGLDQRRPQLSQSLQKTLAESVALLPPRPDFVASFSEFNQGTLATKSSSTSSSDVSPSSSNSSFHPIPAPTFPEMPGIIQELQLLSAMEPSKMQEALDSRPALKETLRQLLARLRHP